MPRTPMPMPLPRRVDGVLGRLAAPSPASRRRAIAAIGLALGLTTLAVLATGGVKYATVHLVYLPIIAAALVFEVRGGLVAAAIAGLLLGPLMPIDTATDEMQHAVNWLTRLAAFCLIGGLAGLVFAVLHRQMAQLRWLHEHDPSTGLLSRDGLLLALEAHLTSHRSTETPLVVAVQLNNLLDIQNTFGPVFAGDLLQCICERVRTIVPDGLPIALVQPDRLVVLLPGTSDALPLRVDMDARLREPYDVRGMRAYVDFAIGAAVFPRHASNAEDLLQKASIAMHVAVRRRLPSVTYDATTDATSQENLLLVGMVPDAIARGELETWHQAKVSLATGAVWGTEALLRWRHPERGLVPPARFVPQVEESPLINDLTRWIIGDAMAGLAACRARGHDVGVAINLSVRNLHDRALLRVLDDAVAHHGVPPESVELEITESSVMDDYDWCAALIRRLRDRGFGVAIDDFGTGHSSLAHLERLPVTTLKIDQAFVRGLATDQTHRTITRAIVDLASALGRRSVAEGVEDDASMAMLREWGCHYGQGHALHRACPVDDLLPWLERPKAAPQPPT